jgi:hypothetical protein
MMKRTWLLLAMLIASCATADGSGKLPKDYVGWSIGYTTQAYMEVWIETIDVEDVDGRVFTRIGSGTAGIDYAGDPAGWSEPTSLGGGRIVYGASLPKRMNLRWQSLAEPQTYRAAFDIPQQARRLMLKRDQSRVTQRWFYRNYLILDLAPGGWVKVWVTGPAGVDSEVLCVRAEIEPKGPYGGQSAGKYRPLTNRAAPYVATHPIPYANWNCGN